MTEAQAHAREDRLASIARQNELRGRLLHLRRDVAVEKRRGFDGDPVLLQGLYMFPYRGTAQTEACSNILAGMKLAVGQLLQQLPPHGRGAPMRRASRIA